MQKKRGLSAVAATLLIILLTLVAVGIIWAVINNIVQRGAEQVELGQYTLDLEIKAAQVQNGDVTVVIVRRNPGSGNFVGMNFIFFDGQNSEIIRQDAALNELEEKTFTFTLTKISTANLKTISVAPIFESRSGRETIGSIADIFDVPANKSIGPGGTIGNFEALGYSGAGKKEYTIPSQSGDIVKFSKAIVDPLDVLPGDNQTFTVIVYSSYGIIDVTSITELDNSILNLDFEKISDDGAGTSTWSASWIVDDTHTIEYRTKITATDSQGNSGSVTLTWTDSCQSLITHGQDSTISATCTTGIDNIEGIDGGSLTIAQDRSLTIDSGSTFIFNQGKSITVTASGARIVSTSTGSFGNGYLFYTDSDEDNYSLDNTLSYSTTSPSLSGFVRAKDATATSDCDDTSSAVQVTRTQNLDADSDNYTVASSSFCASASTWGDSGCTTAGSNYSKNSTGNCLIISSLLGTDCYDLNATAKPGQTSYFPGARGNGTTTINITPVTNGTTIQWLNQGTGNGCGSGSDLWKCVETRDTGSSYLNTSTSNNNFSVELSNISLGAGAEIAKIEIYYQCRKAESGGESKILISEGGTTTVGSSNNCINDASYQIFKNDYTTNPRTGQAWTEGQVNNLQAGARASANSQARVSAVWAVVTYRQNDSAGNNWNSFDYNCVSGEEKNVTSYDNGCDNPLISCAVEPCIDADCSVTTGSTPACGNSYTPRECGTPNFCSPLDYCGSGVIERYTCGSLASQLVGCR